MINKRSQIYISILFILAIVIYGFLIINFKINNIIVLLFWVVSAIIAETLLIPLPNNTVGVSVGFAISLASIIIGGPLLGTTVSLLGFLLRIPKISGRGYVHLFNTEIYKTIFNISQSVIITGIIGWAYVTLGGKTGEFKLIPTLIILLLDIILNTTIISGFLTFATNQKFYKVWISNVKGMFASAIAVGTIGIILAIAFIGYGYGAVILFFGPLLLSRYSFKLYIEMRNLYLSTIQALNKTVEAKDPYTSGHASRVEDFAVQLAEAYSLPFQSIQNIKTASILHDIGKIGINDSILNKAAKLTEDEFQEIMRHPSIGAEIISKVDFLKDITGIIKHHHERYDGNGYPDGISGKEIPIEACILTIADSYDAMTSDRPYRKALTKEEALEEIRKHSGKQFHPELAERFITMMQG